MLKFQKAIKEFIKNEQTKNYSLYKKDSIYLYIIKKRMSKRIIIHLEESGDTVLEQMYPFGGMSKPSQVKGFTLKPYTNKNTITIVLYRGTPLLIKGLDENNFVSAAERYKNGNILFISENEFEKAMLYFTKIQ